jgi:hypothetical protein
MGHRPSELVPKGYPRRHRMSWYRPQPQSDREAGVGDWPLSLLAAVFFDGTPI